MSDQRDLERRVAELEQQLAAVKRAGPRGFRYRSSLTFAEVPLLAIAVGPDPERGELRGHAKGIIALGDIATGVVALGADWPAAWSRSAGWPLAPWPWAARPSAESRSAEAPPATTRAAAAGSGSTSRAR